MLADLLQDHKRLRLDPDVALVQEAVELLDAERVGTDTGELTVVAPARVRRAYSGDRSVRRGTAQRAERVELGGVVPGSEHECRIVVDGGQLQYRGRRRTPFLERGHAAASGGACEAAHVLLDRLPGLERQGHRHATGRADGAFAQLRGQPDRIAKQKEHGLIGLAGDVDRSTPGGRTCQPALHARVDSGQLELVKQLRDQVRVALDGRQRKGPFRPLERAQIAASGKCAGERSVLGRDQHPVLLAPVALELHVVAHRAGPGRRPLGDLGQGVGGVFAEPQAAGLGRQRVHESGSLLVQRDQRAPDARQLVRLVVFEQGLDDRGRAVGGKRQPPALVRAGYVEYALVVAATPTLTLERARQRLADKRRARQVLQQQPHGLRALGVEWHDPSPLGRIPAAPGDRTQQLAQHVVIGKAQHRLALLERRLEKGHELWTIGRQGDGCAVPYDKMLTARDTINPIVTSDTSDCTPIVIFAIGVSGIVSVGEKAVAFVSDTYR